MLEKLLADIRACTICEAALADGVRPVLNVAKGARIAIAGQAPGMRVHKSGVPWDDPSGERLRDWLQVDTATFYDPEKFAIVPMGFCYPGTKKGQGDLPPRPECRATWHDRLFAELPDIELTLCIGQYAIDYHMPELRRRTLTETVQHWRKAMPRYLPLPHPSPRNNIWLKRNPWFEADVIPVLRGAVSKLLTDARP